jgi:hypothetical protein
MVLLKFSLAKTNITNNKFSLCVKFSQKKNLTNTRGILIVAAGSFES